MSTKDRTVNPLDNFHIADYLNDEGTRIDSSKMDELYRTYYDYVTSFDGSLSQADTL